MAYGDAISDHSRTLQAYLKTRGHEGTIYARVIHPKVLEEARPLWAAAFGPSDTLATITPSPSTKSNWFFGAGSKGVDLP